MSIFNKMVLEDRFCSISEFQHFIDIGTKDTYSGPPKLFRIHSIIEMLLHCFQLPEVQEENVAVHDSCYVERVVRFHTVHTTQDC
jgi:Fe-S oxidoreductase